MVKPDLAGQLPGGGWLAAFGSIHPFAPHFRDHRLGLARLGCDDPGSGRFFPGRGLHDPLDSEARADVGLTSCISFAQGRPPP